jgi:FMN phosphatase YigB (HAD superfamily)
MDLNRTAPDDRSLPLAVDLDGTLIRGDVVFWRALWRPASALRGLGALGSGRAAAKAALFAGAAFDAARLPYRRRLVDLLQNEKAAGRTLVLATAADRRAAEAVAAHLGFFDAVFASDGTTHLKAAAKAAALAQAYPNGFVYVGEARADLAVWARAAGAWVVRTPWRPGLAQQVARVARVI